MKNETNYVYLQKRVMSETNEHRDLKAMEMECRKLLLSTGRPGIERLIMSIADLGYFIAPGSTKHHSYVGGLMCHSLETFHQAMMYREEKINGGIDATSMPVESVIIAALLHDLCKADALRYNSATGKVEVKNCGAGHGKRSVQMARAAGLVLTDDERDAIRWHMGGQGSCIDEQKRLEHYTTHPLSDVIQRADKYSINLLG